MQNKKMSGYKTIALRNLLLIGVGAVLALTLAGCSRKQTTQVQTQNELTIWSPLDAEETFLPLIKDFASDNPSIRINYVLKDLADYEGESLNALASLEGPDIWAIKNDWITKHKNKLVSMPREFFAEGKKDTTPLTQAFEQTFWPAQSADFVVDNKAWGVPLYMDQLSLFINKDLLRARLRELENDSRELPTGYLEDSPRTWEEFIAYAKDLTVRDGGGIVRAGAAIGSAQVTNASDILTMIMLQDGASMISADRTRPEFHLPQRKANGQLFNPGTTALNFFTDFARKGSDKEVWSDSLGDAGQAFLDGKVAMLFHYRWFEKTIARQKPELNYAIKPVPQISGATDEVGIAQYWTFTVTKNAESPNAAWGLLKWLTENALGDYAKITNRLSSFEPKEIDQSERANPRYQALIARSWAKPDAVETDRIFRQAIDSVLRGGVNAQTALEAAAAAVGNITVKPTPVPSPTATIVPKK